MKVLTTAPIYYNAEGDTPAEPTTAFGKFLSGAGKLATGVQGALPYAAQIAQRPKSDLKQACGRKPLFGKNKARWNKCADNFYAKQSATPISTEPSAFNSSGDNTMKYALYGVGALVVVGILIFALKKK